MALRKCASPASSRKSFRFPKCVTPVEHCIAKIAEIVARGHDDRRSILQLGYNLGRLSELTGGGREPFWDRWKGPVETWDLGALHALAQELHKFNLPPE